MNINSEKEILKQFIYENTELEKLEDIATEFNIFSALDIIRNEIRHSTFLSWLMTPNETHGLGDYFLKSFLKTVTSKASSLGVDVPSVFDVDSWELSDAEILREWKKIDILVKCESKKFICAIENKIYSEEHSKQLERYRNILDKDYPNYQKLLIYLTVEGDIPSDSNYSPLSYSDIISLVEHLLDSKKNAMGTEALSFISHYRDMLRRYIMRDSDISEVCKKIYRKHKKALELLFEYKPDMQAEIYDCLIEIISNETDLILDDSSKTYIRFIPKDLDFIPKKGESWVKSKRILLFEINNTPKKVTISVVLGPGLKEIRQKLYNIARNTLSLFNKSDRDLTERWFTLYKKPIMSAKDYEDMESEEIRKSLEEKLTKFKKTDLPKIVNEIRKFKED